MKSLRMNLTSISTTNKVNSQWAKRIILIY